jgi:thymidine phosphorylase
MEDRIDPSVGFIIPVKPGDAVRKGDTLATIHALDAAGLKEGKRSLRDAIAIADEKTDHLPLVSTRITADGSARWTRPSI